MSQATLTQSVGTAQKFVPLDFAATQRLPNWRQNLLASFTPGELGRIFADVTERYIAGLRDMTDDARAAALLASAPVLTATLPTLELALALSTESRTGIMVFSEEPEFAYLRGEKDSLPPARNTAVFERTPKPRLPLRRSAQVTSWWTEWSRVPQTLISPDVMAISENPALVASARECGQRIAFRHAGSFLAKARRLDRLAKHGVDVEAVADGLTQRLTDLELLEQPYATRARKIVHALLMHALERSARDLSSFKNVKSLPARLWSATGSLYSARATGLEVLRRGGEAVRFQHGGTHPFSELSQLFSVVELSVSSKFVMFTDGLAKLAAPTDPARHTKPWRTTSLVGGHGDPSIAPLSLDAPERSGRRRVIYAPTFLTGFRKHAMYSLSDPVYLDWQLRLAETLSEMPLDLLCKPHPEGVFSGQRHPLADVAPCTSAPFESTMAEADVFVFDRCSSTTFWRALCTNRPVVLIPIGPPRFHSKAQQILERRCSVVEPWFDEKNLPRVDSELLADAVLGGPGRVDAGEIRELFMGKSAAA
ncbi:MAG: hypothetical protein CL569_16420 [Alphaproteobacteria bacterium]|nr:hypothetical protein [Alphaproteobacteria bacterium]